jgi:hypothetical protein
MQVNVNLKVISFGRIVFEVGNPMPPREDSTFVPVNEKVPYRLPQETVSRIYEIQYEQEVMKYIVPFSTA